MKPIPEACRESMEYARWERSRVLMGTGPTRFQRRAERAEAIADARRLTREIVRALRAARRAEGALLARSGIA